MSWFSHALTAVVPRCHFGELVDNEPFQSANWLHEVHTGRLDEFKLGLEIFDDALRAGKVVNFAALYT